MKEIPQNIYTGHTQKNGAVSIVNTIKTAPFFCVCPVYPPYGFTVWDPTSLQCLLQYEIVKSGRIVADGCKNIVDIVLPDR